MQLSNIEFTARYKGDDCKFVRNILDRIGDKWSIYIIITLSRGPVRFNELRRQVEGISQRMLTLSLRGLERDGIISRKLFPTIPPRVDYELTAVGRTLLDPVMTLVIWAESNKAAINDARDHYDLRSDDQT